MNNNKEIRLRSNKNRVFFHELGHYVANRLNSEEFGLSRVEKIKIKRHVINGNVDFSGETTYSVPDGDKRNKPLENLPQKLADLIYGCYFQSLYTENDLKVCFDYSNPHANGNIDMNKMITALTMFSISSKKRQVFYPYIEQQYFQELKDKSSGLETFFKLKPEDYYIRIDDNETEIDIERLNDETSQGIVSHRYKYLEFISQVEKILEWNTLRF